MEEREEYIRDTLEAYGTDNDYAWDKLYKEGYMRHEIAGVRDQIEQEQDSEEELDSEEEEY